jgi:hypothetical protein
MRTVFSLLAGIIGSAGLLFIAPFAYLTGFHEQSLMYALIGLLLMGLSRLLGFSRLGLEISSIVCIVILGLVYVLNLPRIQALPKDAGYKYRRVLTLPEAVNNCNISGLEGWELAAHAQRLVSNKMSREYYNPWDSPEAAFIRGGGQDFQKTLALKALYDRLGISGRLVFAQVEFAEGNPLRGRYVPILGHVWIRVEMGDEERDVCPPTIQNPAGGCFFYFRDRVRPLPDLMLPLVQLWWVIRGLDFELSGGEWNPSSHTQKL